MNATMTQAAVNQQAVENYYSNLDQALVGSVKPIGLAQSGDEMKQAMSGVARELLMAPTPEHLWRGLWKVCDAYGSPGSPLPGGQHLNMDPQAKLDLLGEMCRQGAGTMPEAVQQAMGILTQANENDMRPAPQPFQWPAPAATDTIKVGGPGEGQRMPLREMLAERTNAMKSQGIVEEGPKLRARSP